MAKENIQEKFEAVQPDEPSINLRILRAHGRAFHFFVDSAEGPEMGLDTEVVLIRAEAARKRLLELPPETEKPE